MTCFVDRAQNSWYHILPDQESHIRGGRQLKWSKRVEANVHKTYAYSDCLRFIRLRIVSNFDDGDRVYRFMCPSPANLPVILIYQRLGLRECWHQIIDGKGRRLETSLFPLFVPLLVPPRFTGSSISAIHHFKVTVISQHLPSSALDFIHSLNKVSQYKLEQLNKQPMHATCRYQSFPQVTKSCFPREIKSRLCYAVEN